LDGARKALTISASTTSRDAGTATSRDIARSHWVCVNLLIRRTMGGISY
jgi:hypothetical protein